MPLPEYENLNHGITLIDTGYTRPGMTACYLMEQGGHVAIIETGVNASVAGIAGLIEQRGYRKEQVEYIMPTHVHLDHAGGVGQLMQLYPHARLVIHPRGARHMVDPTKLIAGASAVYGEENFKRLYGELLPVDPQRVIEADDGYCLDFHGRPLLFIDTPGHARHHFCIVDEMSAGIFTGDTFGISYRAFDDAQTTTGFPTTTPVQFDPAALHQSIDRLMALQPRQMYLTHYGRLTQLASVAEQLHADIDQWVAMAQAMNPEDLHDVEDYLSEQITTYLIHRVMRNNPALSHRQAHELVAFDARLNAQGLAYWIFNNK